VRQASGETLIEDRSQPSTLQCEPEVAAGLAAKIPRGFSADIEAIVAIDALAGPASELPLIPSWHSGSMVTVLRGTRQAGGLLRAINCLRARSPDGRSPGSPNCRSRLHPARTFATAAALRAGSIRRAPRYDRQGNSPDLTDAGTTAVYGQFVHRRSGGKR
jgi:hypothetical protein